MSNKINESDWKWFGNAGHFICAASCRFHLCTQIGEYLISTVGEYWPERPVREIHAQVNDPKWLAKNIVLKGDYFDAAYMERFGYEEIGSDRKYETMVFKAGEPCTVEGCCCGLPKISGSNIDFDAYNDAGSAAKGHLDMCQKWAVSQEVSV
jgi:hypothetical protein